MQTPTASLHKCRNLFLIHRAMLDQRSREALDGGPVVLN